MTWRLAACRLALAATTFATLAACGSSPREFDAPAAARPALYSRSLTGAAASAAILDAMDAKDILNLGKLLELSRPEPARWRGERSGHEFVVTALGTFAGDQGPCRDFQVEATRQGLTERWRGSACQQADRRWRVLR